MGEPIDPFGGYRGRWRWSCSIFAVAGGASDTSADDGAAGERRVTKDTLVSTLDYGTEKACASSTRSLDERRGSAEVRVHSATSTSTLAKNFFIFSSDAVLSYGSPLNQN